ncbi:4-diphosphocytidyl-2-c-methyl-d-erythritol kinase [Cystoisospora suis]|uniref:4-diphosphocytidyl-2-c-methyl-d-erythritol kinase n=1 Tax=Cystoisospora suis TaxID=483139 RepID=A0A2C6KLG2_9APIC|nr:4-diphosphocytidyl-2-c-methyl-d-erythritol kinase [Cystoisospora suis]
MHSREAYRHTIAAALASVFFLVSTLFLLTFSHALSVAPPVRMLSTPLFREEPAPFIHVFRSSRGKPAPSFLNTLAAAYPLRLSRETKRTGSPSRPLWATSLEASSAGFSPKVHSSRSTLSEKPLVSPVTCAQNPPSSAISGSRYTSPRGPVCLVSPAKINLFLRVFPRAPGAAFHPILSLFSFVSLSDYLAVYTLPPVGASATTVTPRSSEATNPEAAPVCSPSFKSATLNPRKEQVLPCDNLGALSGLRAKLPASSYPENPFPSSSLSSLSFPYSCVSEDGDILLSSKPLPCSARQNLILKALSLYRRKVAEFEKYSPLSGEVQGLQRSPRCTPRFLVYLHKNIPIQAGLGGASSNAASALLAAYSLAPPPFHYGERKPLTNGLGSDVAESEKERLPGTTPPVIEGRQRSEDTPGTKEEQIPSWLVDIGAQLGSDVPFFLLSRGAALCEGRGEIVRDFTKEVSSQLSFLSRDERKPSCVKDDEKSIDTPSSECPSSPRLYIYVIKRKEGLGTKAVYDAFRAQHQSGLPSPDNDSRSEVPNRSSVHTPAEQLSEALKHLPNACSFPFTRQLHPSFLPSLFINALHSSAEHCLPSLKALHASMSCYVYNDDRAHVSYRGAPTQGGTVVKRKDCPEISPFLRRDESGRFPSTDSNDVHEKSSGENETKDRPVLLASGMTGSGSAFVGIGVEETVREETPKEGADTQARVGLWSSFLQSERMRGSKVFRCRFLTKTHHLRLGVASEKTGDLLTARERKERSSTDSGHKKETGPLWFDFQTDFEELGEKGWMSLMEKENSCNIKDRAREAERPREC